MIMLAAAVIIAALMALTRRDVAYLAVLVWTLIGIAVKQALHSLWDGTLQLLAHRAREDLLADLYALEPVIFALGGEQGVVETFRAIQDVGR